MVVFLFKKNNIKNKVMERSAVTTRPIYIQLLAIDTP